MSTRSDDFRLDDFPARLTGWIDAPARHAVASEFGTFSDRAPNLMRAYDPSDKSPILLYKAFDEVLGSGKWPSWVPQGIGDCTSFGSKHCVDCLECVDAVLASAGATVGEFREVCSEFIYATGRAIAGMLRPHLGGAGDGCYGSAVVKAMRETGLITYEMLGDGYSAERAASWGWHGAPDEWLEKASNFTLGTSALVKTWDELVTALRNGYPVVICSNYGFRAVRDSQGFCKARGIWNHCMSILGARFDREGACIFNSWPEGWIEGPTALGQWWGSFWADRAAVEGILRQGDSFAVGKAPIFVPRKLPSRWSYANAA